MKCKEVEKFAMGPIEHTPFLFFGLLLFIFRQKLLKCAFCSLCLRVKIHQIVSSYRPKKREMISVSLSHDLINYKIFNLIKF